MPLSHPLPRAVLSTSWPQQRREPQRSRLSAMVQGKPGPPPDQTHADPFFRCRATTATFFGCAEEDFSFTTRAQRCGRMTDKAFCPGECTTTLCLCCLHGCITSREVFTGGFAVRKVALSSWLPYFASLATKFAGTGGKKTLFLN